MTFSIVGWHIYGTTSILLIVECDLGFLQMIIIEAGSHGTSQQPRTCKPDDDVFFLFIRIIDDTYELAFLLTKTYVDDLPSGFIINLF